MSEKPKIFTPEQCTEAFLKAEQWSKKLKEVKSFLDTQKDNELPDEISRSVRQSRSFDANKMQYILKIVKNDYNPEDYMDLKTPAKMEKSLDSETNKKLEKYIVKSETNTYKVKKTKDI